MEFLTIPNWANALLQTLIRALRERDPYTYGHCLRVSRNAKLLAKAAGLNEEIQRNIELASIFHDLGKLGIPDSILLKPGKLTLQEEAIMQTHPAKSEEILKPLGQLQLFKPILPGIRSHHERIDGKGYPDNLKGDIIPLFARIILIADTFDAMTTNRPYRSAMAYEIAYKELKTFSGRQFDSKLVQIFLKAHPTWSEMEEEITAEFVASTYKRAA